MEPFAQGFAAELARQGYTVQVLPGFTPMGPWLVTPDELDNPDDLELVCDINGEQVQKGHTRDLIFSVPALITELSGVVSAENDVHARQATCRPRRAVTRFRGAWSVTEILSPAGHRRPGFG